MAQRTLHGLQTVERNELIHDKNVRELNEIAEQAKHRVEFAKYTHDSITGLTTSKGVFDSVRPPTLALLETIVVTAFYNFIIISPYTVM
ncbi:hypothetical protein H5410_005930 [Solanum commersonii]|uniref:Uncharacterized protein n=1 Tax=Solanum commersonii TaxID=4109 RepID=A0A9J6A8G7_SOLCO|nr:hypothetical protein H5410_005930 [Solanum commersonii]